MSAMRVTLRRAAAWLILPSLVGCGGASELPDSWTHKELADHLAAKGIPVEVEGKPLLSRDGTVAAVLLEPGEKHGGVLAYACRDRGAAREQAGSMGGGSFSSGRFAFGP